MDEDSEIDLAPPDCGRGNEPIYPPGLVFPPLRLSKDRRHRQAQFGLPTLFRLVTWSAITCSVCRIDVGIVVVTICAVAVFLVVFAGVLVPWTALFTVAILIVCGFQPIMAIVLVPFGAITIGTAAIVRWRHPWRPVRPQRWTFSHLAP